mgnify:CR=1 FL=1
MYKCFITVFLFFPSIVFADSDPCETVESTLDQVKVAHKNNAQLKDVLELSGKHKGIVKLSWTWLEKGELEYSAWRTGQKAGCEYLNQGAYYYPR